MEATPEIIHGYEHRATDILLTVHTTAETITGLTFTTGPITKTGLVSIPIDTGFNVEVSLTAAEMSFGAGSRRYELTGVYGGQVRTLLTGWFTIDPQPTEV